MKHAIRVSLRPAVVAGMVVLALLGCRMDMPGAGGDPVVNRSLLNHVVWSAWSEPVPIGEPINSTASDAGAFLSRDGLTLYFNSNRTGSVEGTAGALAADIWYARRDSIEGAWGDAKNLAMVNTGAIEQAPYVSNDGRLLFFVSSRDGTFDIFMSSRTDPNDCADPNLGWGPPEKLGPGINTDDNQEAGPVFLQRAEEGPVDLYFNRAAGAAPNAGFPDIYCAAIDRKGKVLIDAVPVDELNVAGVVDSATSIRRDGLEIFFQSTREGNLDLFTSTRESVRDPWGPPVKLAAPLSTVATETQPRISWDGTTLLFASTRTPTLGGSDIWMSTRTEIGKE